ncbi:sodium:solute symporter family protein [Methanomassiliicoccus luminyensis]|uniref:sodium:solute symporter family protein n=1 Tax=Methanomassiliicoccus luminyensis TaxID=1080712 RepID=UPI000674D978|nr:sodium:solute symporter family protein [Methanomassiliicoccus luminyensis]
MVDTTVFAICAIVYLGVTMYLGYLGYKQTKGADDYMVAGRKVHPWIIGISYGATFISTSAIVGFGGIGAMYGLGVIWLTVLNIGLGILVAFILYGKRTRRIGQQLKAVTFPDLLGKRFNSPFMQYATGILILIAMPLYCAAIIIGGAWFIHTTFGLDYGLSLVGFAAITALYVVFGGLIAVLYTDAMQGLLMLVGMTVLLVLTFLAVGGVGEGFTALSNLSPQIPDNLQAGGLYDWTAMPAAGSTIWLTLVTTMVMGVGIGVLAQPQLSVRFLTAKDDRSLNRAIAVGGPFLLMMTGVAFTVGPLTNVWFWNEQGQLAVAAAGGNVDNVIPLFINSATPDLFVVMFLLVLLAAAMSTLSGIFHTMGTTAGYDLYRHIAKKDQPSKKVTQIATCVMIVASVALAFVMPANIIARATAMFMGLCACAFLPALTYALYSKRPAALPAKLSLSVGAISWFLWTVFVHAAEAGPLGICQALFGQVTLLGAPFNVIDPLIIGLPLAIIALVVGIALSTEARERATEPETA